MEPNNPDAFVEYAKERLASGEHQEALLALQRACHLDPHSPYYRQLFATVGGESIDTSSKL